MADVNDGPDGKDVWVSSGYGYNTRKPFVALAIGGETLTQMTPDEAREIGLNLIRCAEAAETDTFIMEWLSKKVGFKNEVAQAQILNEFRKFRNEK